MSGLTCSATLEHWLCFSSVENQMSEKTSLEFSVGYLKSSGSVISGFMLQTGFIHQLYYKK